MPIPDLENKLKANNALYHVSRDYDKLAAKDPENPDLMFQYLKTVDPGFQRFNKRSDVERVDPNFWDQFTGVKFRNKIKDNHERAESELVRLVGDDYKAALDLVNNNNLHLILSDLAPMPLTDPKYKDIIKAHDGYKAVSSLLESTADDEIKIDTYLRKVIKAEGEFGKQLRRFYGKHKGAINLRLEEMKGEKLGELLKYFSDADGNLEHDKIKSYVKDVIDATPADKKDDAYLAIGKYVA